VRAHDSSFVANLLREGKFIMAESVSTPSADTELRIRRIQWFTIIWMGIEVAVAALAAIRSNSVVLAAYGADSVIELLSAVTVLARFSSSGRLTEEFASKITGWLLISLAIYIATDSLYRLIADASRPKPSYIGIGLLFAAGLIMPWLSRRKRQLAMAARSSALQADAAQSSLCAYLSWIALAGLLLNAVANLTWADPLAALGLLPIVCTEAKESFQGHPCHCG